MMLERCIVEDRAVPAGFEQVRSIVALLRTTEVACDRCHVERARVLVGARTVCRACAGCLHDDRRVALAREERRGFATPARDARERRLRQALAR